MAVTLDSLSRLKSVTTNALSLDILAGTPVETDAAEESIFIPFNLSGVDQPTFQVSDVTTDGSTGNLSTINDGFANVKVGDGVSGTGIAVGSVVTTVTDSNNIVVDLNTTAAGTVTATIDPNNGVNIDPTLFGIKVRFTKSNANLTLTVTYHTYDGSLEDTVGTEGTATSTVTLGTAAVNLDAFLTGARVPRSV